jgi:hypothetical protein
MPPKTQRNKRKNTGEGGPEPKGSKTTEDWEEEKRNGIVVSHWIKEDLYTDPSMDLFSTPIAHDLDRRCVFVVNQDYNVIEIDYSASPATTRVILNVNELPPQDRSSIARSIFVVPSKSRTDYMYLVVCIHNDIVAVSVDGVLTSMTRAWTNQVDLWVFSPVCNAMDAQGRLLVHTMYGKSIYSWKPTKGTASRNIHCEAERLSLLSEMEKITRCISGESEGVLFIEDDTAIKRIGPGGEVERYATFLDSDDSNGSQLRYTVDYGVLSGRIRHETIPEVHLANNVAYSYSVPGRARDAVIDRGCPLLLTSLCCDPLYLWPPGLVPLVYDYAHTRSFLVIQRYPLSLYRMSY